MKLSSGEWCVLAITGLFLAFTVGYFVGTGNSGTVTVTSGVEVLTTTDQMQNEDTENSEEDSDIPVTSLETDEAGEAAVEETVTMEEDTSEETGKTEMEGTAPEVEEEISGDETAESTADSGLININTATAEELETLPGIGEELASRIVLYREENGPFQTIEDITSVNGIGEGRLSAIQDYITVGE